MAAMQTEHNYAAHDASIGHMRSWDQINLTHTSLRSCGLNASGAASSQESARLPPLLLGFTSDSICSTSHVVGLSTGKSLEQRSAILSTSITSCYPTDDPSFLSYRCINIHTKTRKAKIIRWSFLHTWRGKPTRPFEVNTVSVCSICNWGGMRPDS